MLAGVKIKKIMYQNLETCPNNTDVTYCVVSLAGTYLSYLCHTYLTSNRQKCSTLHFCILHCGTKL